MANKAAIIFLMLAVVSGFAVFCRELGLFCEMMERTDDYE